MNESENEDIRACCPETEGCDTAPPLSRREFIAATGAAAASLTVPPPAGLLARAVAGPFEPASRAEHLIPADKKLGAAWLRALRDRGAPEVFSGEELRYLGMPVGGICCGQLYLGGDGRLWLWDIFRSRYRSDYGGMSSGTHYAQPPEPGAPGRNQAFEVVHGFTIRIREPGGDVQVRTLDGEGFRDVSFRGEYPIGRVAYRDEDCPVEVELEAFSPFVPLDADDSALPATILAYRLRNRSAGPIRVDVVGHLENAVCPDVDDADRGRRVNRLVRSAERTTVVMHAAPHPETPGRERRPDIVFATFEGDAYEGWTSAGTAFGDGPFPREAMRDYHDVSNHVGERLVNSHHTRAGGDVRAGDAHLGSLTGTPFTIARRYINFRIGGGHHPGLTCIDLLVDGLVVRTATGRDANRMRAESFRVDDLEGREATLRIVDAVDGPWGNIGIDHVVFSDAPARERRLEALPGFGSMAITLLDGAGGASMQVPREAVGTAALFDEVLSAGAGDRAGAAVLDMSGRPIGAVGRSLDLGPGETADVDFVLSWWFPHYPDVRGEFAAIQDIERLHRHYKSRFGNAAAVAGYVARNVDRLAGLTRLWSRTWYDGTLPFWLLDRTFISIDCLATQTCHWFDNGRFYGWEGVTCCPGTCQHVWNYAQGLARIFPRLERITREHVDYGIAFHETGELDYRAESARHVAHDGQCGTILRAYREHTTAPDGAFLARTWPRIRRSIEFLIAEDGDDDGLLEGRQYNTLDQAWFGPMGWISSMYLAALKAGRAMALEMGDDGFAARCAVIIETGRRKLVEELFEDGYFIHRPPDFEATNTNDGCHIDQVLGQSLAWQVGLPRVVEAEQARAALRALWTYNFAPDAGAYRNAMQGVIAGGRWYAMPGEAGLVMCTWPRGGAAHAPGAGRPGWAVGYFNECMNGFEYQVASHMIHESRPDDPSTADLLEKGLAITRAVHDRYHPSRRNPYNEIECSDHYSRSMAAYGVFLACCGFEHHGPRGHIGFAPRLNPERFRAAFTASEGWGTYRQVDDGQVFSASIELAYGRLRLRSVGVSPAGATIAPERLRITIQARGEAVPIERIERREHGLLVRVNEEIVLQAGDRLRVKLESPA